MEKNIDESALVNDNDEVSEPNKWAIFQFSIEYSFHSVVQCYEFNFRLKSSYDDPEELEFAVNADIAG